MQVTATLERGVLYLSGRIDEEFEADKAFHLAQGPNLILDLSRVASINSVGIMRWVPAITHLSSEKNLSVRRVAYSLVMQANAVLGFFGDAKIESVMAPYFCPKCNTNRLVEVTSEELAKIGWLPPEKNCPSCDEPLEFDELDNFFTFLGASLK